MRKLRKGRDLIEYEVGKKKFSTKKRAMDYALKVNAKRIKKVTYDTWIDSKK